MITDMCDFYKLNYCSGESKTIKFPFNFLRLPPAPPAVFLEGKEIFGFACATGRSAPEARWKCCSRPVGREIKSTRSVPLPIQNFLQNKFGFRPKGTANFEFLHFRLNLERSFAPRKSRFARKRLNLQGFATLRVGKKKCFGFGLGSSSCLSGEKNHTRLRPSFAFAKQPIFFVSPMAKLGSDNF